ncbi:MAG: hypothetical protein ACI90V_007964 [Bacillariaceae sp.]|jgi:hypothetical protein
MSKQKSSKVFISLNKPYTIEQKRNFNTTTIIETKIKVKNLVNKHSTKEEVRKQQITNLNSGRLD